MSTGPQGRTPTLRPRPAPVASEADAPERPQGIEETLTTLLELAREREASGPSPAASLLDEEAIGRYERKIARASRWGGWVWGVIALVGTIFSGGVAWAVFAGANATDDEVTSAVHEEMADHNGGTHPDVINPTTHTRVGDHPDMRQAITHNAEAIGELTKQAAEDKKKDRKRDKLSEYQFALGRWESAVMEAERAKRRPPKKPQRLDELEEDLMLGKYD